MGIFDFNLLKNVRNSILNALGVEKAKEIKK